MNINVKRGIQKVGFNHYITEGESVVAQRVVTQEQAGCLVNIQ